MSTIYFYRVSEHPYGIFSNFHRSPIEISSTIYLTTEHYFQSQKFPTSPSAQHQIITARTPSDAATLGRNRSFPLRPDWEQVKDSIMKEALMAKFKQHAKLREVLLGTGDRKLVEHTRNDSYWADGGDGSGKNMLGILLMDVRRILREEMEKKIVVDLNRGNVGNVGGAVDQAQVTQAADMWGQIW
ncbi:hypothetical protein HK097_005111 [Rhizophlyctis rosea]|uniref:NADAR domain-containing protein n=1 Tax=Rhizophlyctis rosea TaxID=64517 RepID=A0AAD5X5N5_9FUNG|nr:hypothetical protein HK097_005111 [Rhizophlyctis rosea]